MSLWTTLARVLVLSVWATAALTAQTHTLTQNTRGLPASNTDGNVLQDQYTYDQNANVTGIADQIYGKSRGMAYDGQDRLVVANAPNLWGNGAYSYNALDNLTASTVGGRNSSHNYDPSTNRLQSINTNGVYTGFSFDAQGNITAKGSQGYVFDQANRLQLAAGPANASYTYDGLGRRLSANGSNGNQTTVYSQAGQMLYASAQQGAVVNTTSYVYLGGKLIGEEGSSGRIYSHTDALGSPVARTNQAAQYLSNTWYEPYGKTAAGVEPQRLGFTGHVNDVDTGLVYMQQRYYDPMAGRFLSVDQVLTDANTGASFNRYVYAQNNPYKYIDPDGRDVWGANNGWERGTEWGREDALNKAYNAVGNRLDMPAARKADMVSGDRGGLGTMATAVKPALADVAQTTVKAEVTTKAGTFPDAIFTGKRPHQTTPGISSTTQERYNPATGKLEKSEIKYDQYGRQVERKDFTNHGYGDATKPKEYHSDPHTHTYEYGPAYGPNGKETRINHD